MTLIVLALHLYLNFSQVSSQIIRPTTTSTTSIIKPVDKNEDNNAKHTSIQYKLHPITLPTETSTSARPAQDITPTSTPVRPKNIDEDTDSKPVTTTQSQVMIPTDKSSHSQPARVGQSKEMMPTSTSVRPTDKASHSQPARV